MVLTEEKTIDMSGICINCDNRRNCDFMRNIKSYVRDQRCANRIKDIEISVYSCENYEPEVSKACGENDVCLHCKSEI